MTRRSRDSQLSLFGSAPPKAVTPLTAATTRKRSGKVLRGKRGLRKATPAPAPWRCAVLAVDTAQRSGWCVSICGEYKDSGEVNTLDAFELGHVTRWAYDLAQVAGVPLVLVLEAPYGGNVDVVAALGAVRERWLKAWRDAGQAAGRVVLVKPATWRAAVLGRSTVGMPREVVRQLEQQVASGLLRGASIRGPLVGADEAPAILIARWASHAALVGHAAGKRAQRASVAQWTKGGT